MSSDNLAGQTLGQYEIRERLGGGGMGVVYRAYHAGLHREVAVKVLPDALAQDSDYLKRFAREVEIVASLEQTHIVPIYDYGTQRSVSYVVMRLLTGGSLAERLRESVSDGRPLPSLAEIAALLRQMASALDYAHDRNVVHRDIKPGNVMFDNQGEAYLVDFGIARLVNESTSLTATGSVIGTTAYIAPELWSGQPASPASDQYALAIMVYELLTGRRPFEAVTPVHLMHMHLNELPTPPQAYRPDIPQAVSLVLDRALAKDPTQRFPTVTAFAQAFEGAVAGAAQPATGLRPHFRASRQAGSLTPSQPSRAPTRPPTHPPSRRGPLLLGAVVTLLLMVALAAVLLNGRAREIDFDTTLTALAVGAAPTTASAAPTTVSAAPTAISTETPALVVLVLPTTLTSATSAETAEPTRLPTQTDAPDTVTPVASSDPHEPDETAVISLSIPTAAPTATLTSGVPGSDPPLPAATIATLDLAAIADTLDAQAAAASATQRALDQTATATLWTSTPTPNITATIDAFRTRRAVMTAEQADREATATATLWTPTDTLTPSNTPTFTQTPTFTLTPTDTPTPTFTLTPTLTLTPSNTPTFTLTPSNTPTPNPVDVALERARTFGGSNDDWKALYPAGFTQAFDGVPMALVPAGCFTIGANPKEDDEQNGNQICFDQPFWLDLTETTRADFDRLGGVKAQGNGFDGARHPVENITWFEARDFCAQRGARLPTEAEWEYAARGPDDWDYPWGDAWDAAKAVWNRSSNQGTADVGSIAAGASWVGAQDMSGNVWEWTGSLYQSYPYRADDGREADSGDRTDVQRVLRGGSWNFNDPYLLRAALRDWYYPVDWSSYLGFRCARSLD